MSLLEETSVGKTTFSLNGSVQTEGESNAEPVEYSKRYETYHSHHMSDARKRSAGYGVSSSDRTGVAAFVKFVRKSSSASSRILEEYEIPQYDGEVQREYVTVEEYEEREW